MKINEARDKATEELVANLRELRHELFNLRSQKATEQFENPAQIKKTKKDIARILTVLRERELEESRARDTVFTYPRHDDKPEYHSSPSPQSAE